MTNLLNTFETKQIKKLTSNKRIPAFRSGDLIKVTVKIVEGERSRTQAFEGICIARKNNGSNSKFTVRKVSHGEGVERVFPLFSPIISNIEVLRKGDVKRSKLYYLRDRKGKSARISTRDRGHEADQYELNVVPEEKIDQIEKNEEVKKEAPVIEDTKAEVKKETKEEVPIDATNSKAENIQEPKNKTADSAEINQDIAVENNEQAKKKSESAALEAGKTKDESSK